MYWCRRRSRRSCRSPTNRVDGFLAAGHVCSVMGTWQYRPLVEKFNVPIVVTGFEPLDVLEGIRRVVVQLEAGTRRTRERVRTRGHRDGQRPSAAMLDDVFDVCDRQWRGIGEIPTSGWRLSDRYREFDAEARFDVGDDRHPESELCRSGEVLQGLIKPARVRSASARSARLARRSARRWCRARARALRTTSTAVSTSPSR